MACVHNIYIQRPELRNEGTPLLEVRHVQGLRRPRLISLHKIRTSHSLVIVSGQISG